jgi:hypothetical protein
LDDGPLLAAMDGRFDALITVDKSLPKQQVIATRSFAVVLLRARTNRLADLVPLVPELLAALSSARPGMVLEVGT